MAMQYSQKYCLVSFLQPVEINTKFDTTEWPLHVTIADVFAIDYVNSNLNVLLSKMLSTTPIVETSATSDTVLGTTPVVLLHKNEAINALHKNLIMLLESQSATFDTPEYTMDGFLPHCTIQTFDRIFSGDKVVISSVALVDMYPNKNWERRKVLSLYKLASDSGMY